MESALTLSLELLVCLDRFSARRSLTVCFTLTPWYTRLLQSPETEANGKVTISYRWGQQVTCQTLKLMMLLSHQKEKNLEFEMDSNESYFLLLDENLPTLRVDGRDTPLSPTQWLFKVTFYFPSSLSKFVPIRFTIYALVTRSRVG